MKLFFSYGHDRNSVIVERLKTDLEKRGHEIWIDREKLEDWSNPSHDADWRAAIAEGVRNSDMMLSFASSHALREGGVCLDELKIAVYVKGALIQSVLLERNIIDAIPSNISHRQVIDMSEWDGFPYESKEFDVWYNAKLANIVDAIEGQSAIRYQQELEEIRRFLNPGSVAPEDTAANTQDYAERPWLSEIISEWFQGKRSKALLITAPPGWGKTIFASHEFLYNPYVAAAISCRWSDAYSSDPDTIAASIAFQMAVRYPDYRAALLRTIREEYDDAQAHLRAGLPKRSLFRRFVTDPVQFLIDGERKPFLIIIDGLDEVRQTVQGVRRTNGLAEEIGELLNNKDSSKLFRFVLLSREDAAAKNPLTAHCECVSLESFKDNVSQDIKEYVGKRLPEADQALRDAIVANSDGDFLYAEVICRQAKDELLAIDNLPNSLTAAYRHYFDRVVDEGYFENGMREAIEVLAATPEPIPRETLRRAVSWEGRDRHKEQVFMKRFGMYIRERADKSISLFHKSFSDWLHSDAAEEYIVDEGYGIKLLAEACYSAYQSGLDTMNEYELSQLIPLCKALGKERSPWSEELKSDTELAALYRRKQSELSSFVMRERYLSFALDIYRCVYRTSGAYALEIAETALDLSDLIRSADNNSTVAADLSAEAYETLRSRDDYADQHAALLVHSLRGIVQPGDFLWAMNDYEPTTNELSTSDLAYYSERLLEERNYAEAAPYLSELALRIEQDVSFTFETATNTISLVVGLRKCGEYYKSYSLLEKKVQAVSDKYIYNPENAYYAASLYSLYGYLLYENLRFDAGDKYTSMAEDVLQRHRSDEFPGLAMLQSENEERIALSLLARGNRIEADKHLRKSCETLLDGQHGRDYSESVVFKPLVQKLAMLSREESDYAKQAEIRYEDIKLSSPTTFSQHRFRQEYVLAYAGMAEGLGLQDATAAIDCNMHFTHDHKEMLKQLIAEFHHLFPAIDLAEAAKRLENTVVIVKPGQIWSRYYPDRNELVLSGDLPYSPEKVSSSEPLFHLAHFLVNIISSHGESTGFNDENDTLIALNEGYSELLGLYIVGKIRHQPISSVRNFYFDEMVATNLISKIIGDSTLFRCYFEGDTNAVVDAMIDAEEMWQPFTDISEIVKSEQHENGIHNSLDFEIERAKLIALAGQAVDSFSNGDIDGAGVLCDKAIVAIEHYLLKSANVSLDNDAKANKISWNEKIKSWISRLNRYFDQKPKEQDSSLGEADNALSKENKGRAHAPIIESCWLDCLCLHVNLLDVSSRIAVLSKDYDRARDLLQRFFEEARAIGFSEARIATPLYRYGSLWFKDGKDFNNAERAYLQIVDLFDTRRDNLGFNTDCFNHLAVISLSSYVECMNQLAVMYREIGRLPDACQAYSKAILSMAIANGMNLSDSSTSDYVWMVRGLSVVELKNGEISRAYNHMREALKLMGKLDESVFDYMRIKALCYAEMAAICYASRKNDDAHFYYSQANHIMVSGQLAEDACGEVSTELENALQYLNGQDNT